MMKWKLCRQHSAGGPRFPSKSLPRLRRDLDGTCDGELAVATDLRPIKKAIDKLCERYPAMCLAAALASPRDQLDDAGDAYAVGMTALRRVDFIGGRLAARQALNEAGYTDPVVIAVDAQGVPLFPQGYVGSIAHKHGRAVASVARAEVVYGIGIDLEFDENHDENSLVAEVVTEVEQSELTSIRAAEPTILSPATLVLAAKEALFKAVFPVTRIKFGFDEASLIFAPEDKSFRAVRFPGDEQLVVKGGFELAGRWILAVALVTT